MEGNEFYQKENITFYFLFSVTLSKATFIGRLDSISRLGSLTDTCNSSIDLN